MMKKTFTYILTCFLAGVFVVFFLLLRSKAFGNSHNHFLRLFPSAPLNSKTLIDINYNSYYFAGSSHNNIYLGNVTAPLHFLIVNSNLSDTHAVNLNRLYLDDKMLSGIKAFVDSSNIYLINGNSGSFLINNLQSGKVTHLDEKNSFSLAVPLSASSFVLRTYDSTLGQNILCKKTLSKNVKYGRDLLTKQIDGKFCTDGMIKYSPDASRLIYIYYYRNEFICMDTNLNVIYRNRTIDTISRAHIKIDKVVDRNIVTASVIPILTVNKKCCINKKYLFVNSGMIADNEDKSAFNNQSVVDAYSLSDGAYKFSFYLPEINHFKVNNFQVYDSTLVAIYDHYLVKFGIRLP